MATLIVKFFSATKNVEARGRDVIFYQYSLLISIFRPGKMSEGKEMIGY
jgi:hypothetical protein